jgi:hypothetical protein
MLPDSMFHCGMAVFLKNNHLKNVLEYHTYCA